MTYIWRRNSEKIQGEEDVHVAGPNLTMRHISKKGGGNYSCQAVEEGLESDWSHGHDLDVQYGPEQILFNGTTSTVTAAAGAPLTVRCSADCNPACTVTWWNTSRHRLVTGHREAVLSTPAVDRSGQYMCHVYNTHGNAWRNLKLDKPSNISYHTISYHIMSFSLLAVRRARLDIRALIFHPFQLTSYLVFHV
ncbi:hemicentin-2-like [Haliotis rubra]|uniref:hemicentin-2-like n=1 Tax=Haliotis rubra TaxID=36100 RepID=UPI001EE56672|nr:hemicentin-2-like [Haliotis rubra]